MSVTINHTHSTVPGKPVLYDFSVNCDCFRCKSVLVAKERTHQQLQVFMKCMGWSTARYQGVWAHTCPKCVQKERDQLAKDEAAQKEC